MSNFEANYYACGCGGTFYVDLRAQIYGIAPCIYRYICDKCGARKSMPCLQEAQEMNGNNSEFEKQIPTKRVFTLR